MYVKIYILIEVVTSLKLYNSLLFCLFLCTKKIGYPPPVLNVEAVTSLNHTHKNSFISLYLHTQDVNFKSQSTSSNVVNAIIGKNNYIYLLSTSTWPYTSCDIRIKCDFMQTTEKKKPSSDRSSRYFSQMTWTERRRSIPVTTKPRPRWLRRQVLPMGTADHSCRGADAYGTKLFLLCEFTKNDIYSNFS